jgi:ribosome-associated toxin RatA of RatAB toxin-antitoxin module
MTNPANIHQLAESGTVAQPQTLRQGKVAVEGQSGQYTAQVLVQASPDVAWDVLTDFDSFSDFLPTVVSSEVIQTQGDRTVVEQVDRRQVFLMTVDSTVRTENRTHPDQQRIDFHLVDGDLKKMKGYWQVQPVVSDSGAEPDQAIVIQTVEADADKGVFDGAFYSIFEDSLHDNLQAIKAEIERRHQAG